jgi:hypothetical protein
LRQRHPVAFSSAAVAGIGRSRTTSDREDRSCCVAGPHTELW